MPSIFSKIIAGEIPSDKVWEDAMHFAFLDINHWCEGHTMVVPKAEHDYLFDMDDDAYTALHLPAKARRPCLPFLTSSASMATKSLPPRLTRTS